MRILHTGDWHLGHTLRDQPRIEEHAAFLGWLLVRLTERVDDALLIAGDVFDSANPPTSALSMFYRFLAAARAVHPTLDIIVIGGNHDSAARLDAPRPLLEALRVHMAGGLPRRDDGRLDPERLIYPLHRADGGVGAWAVAVPYLRPSDVAATADDVVGAVRAVVAEAVALGAARREPGQALVLTGHCYLSGARLSEDSERKIQRGNQDALPLDVFPPEVAYVALGHLHLAQPVGAPHVRYSGSPIPLSMREVDYPHQVVAVTLDGDSFAGVEALPVPRVVDMLRLPPEGHRPLAEVLPLLEALPELSPDTPRWRRPFLEVRVQIDGPEPDLRRQVEAALDGRAPRLVKLDVIRTGRGLALADHHAVDLGTLAPEEVFRRRWARDHEGPPPDALLAAFHELRERVAQEEDG